MNASRRFISRKTSVQPRDGFTLIELCVVIAVVTVLAAMLLPALAGTRPDSQAFQCMNNQKQIILAWQMYAADNNDLLPPNDFYSSGATPTPYLGPSRGQLNWVGGGENFSASNHDNTNTIDLVQWAALGTYNTNAATYHCPADTSANYPQGPRVRSVSMNATVGTAWNVGITATYPKGSALGSGWLRGSYQTPGPNTSIWQTYPKISSMVRPHPSNLFVILDENPNSISDPTFNVGMGPTADANGNATYNSFIDIPGSYHNGGCTFAFADGHVEIHRWLGPVVKTATAPEIPANDAASLADLRWLQARTTAVK
jgi:prepilin-type N-terminal cleavage/methylation domain-containing protein/prepilin-type processing-associated H-X9-DG protein